MPPPSRSTHATSSLMTPHAPSCVPAPNPAAHRHTTRLMSGIVPGTAGATAADRWQAMPQRPSLQLQKPLWHVPWPPQSGLNQHASQLSPYVDSNTAYGGSKIRRPAGTIPCRINVCCSTGLYWH